MTVSAVLEITNLLDGKTQKKGSGKLSQKIRSVTQVFIPCTLYYVLSFSYIRIVLDGKSGLIKPQVINPVLFLN